MSAITIEDVPDRGRFELLVDGRLTSLATYVDHGRVRSFPHTETVPGEGGKGYATRLVTEALRQTRAAGLEIDPVCPFVRNLVARQSEA